MRSCRGKRCRRRSETAPTRNDGYNRRMGTLTADYLEAIEHLPDGATLTLHNVGWDQYEHVRDDIGDRPGLRISFDCGKLEIMTTSPEHEAYASFIDALVHVLCEELGSKLQSYGRTTWMR